MERCTICGPESDLLTVYYYCDEDIGDVAYCAKHFDELKCEEKHGEGCATMVIETPEDSVEKINDTTRETTPN